MRFEFRHHDAASIATHTADVPGTDNSTSSIAEATARPVRVAIDRKRLQALLETGVICAADFHCLDCESKHCVWKLCLQACKRRLFPSSGQ